MRPRFPIIKRTLPIYRLSENVFRIGAQLGITSEFTDPKLQMWDLVNLLDGREVAEVISEILRLHPELSEDDIKGGFEILASHGFIDENYDDATLSDRYRPNVEYFASIPGGGRPAAFQSQRTLEQSHILLLGVGGGGSNIACLLAGMGIGRITIVDSDVVEESNLGRQFLFTEPDIGKPKVDVAAQRIKSMNQHLSVRPIRMRVDSAKDVENLLQDVDLVICALDEPPFVAQRRVNLAVVRAGIPCVFGATQLTHGRVFTINPGQTGCFDCLHLYYSRNDPKFVDQFRGFQESYFKPPTIAYGPSIWSITLVMVDEAVRLLTRYTDNRTLGRQYEIDYINYTSFSHPEWPKFDDCPTCGNGNYHSWPIFAHCNDGVS